MIAVTAAVSAHSATAGSGPTLVAETTEQLPGKMLRFGGAAAIAAGQQLAAGREDLGKLLAPFVHDGRGHMCVAGSDGQVVEVRADQLHTLQVAHNHGLSLVAAWAGRAVVVTPDSPECVCSSATAATTSEGLIEVRQG